MNLCPPQTCRDGNAAERVMISTVQRMNHYLADKYWITNWTIPSARSRNAALNSDGQLLARALFQARVCISPSGVARKHVCKQICPVW